MKKFIIVIAAVIMALPSFAADVVKSDRPVTKDYNLKGFYGIDAGSIVEVQLTKSETWKVSVTLPEALEDYLDVKMNNGKLSINLRQAPLKIRKNYGTWVVTATVSMPELRSLNLSGAIKFSCDDSFDLGNGTFKMDLSGASKAKGLDIIAKELVMDMGGAASADLAGDFHVARIEMGGAAKCHFNINADELDQEISGAAKAYHSGEFGSIELEASGAGVFSFTGSAEKIEIEGSGASKIETSKGKAIAVEATLSGATYCEVNALENLKVDASGGSSLRYVDNDGLNLDIRSINRGSSVTKMR